MQENVDEVLAGRFEFVASCLFASFLPFCFAPWATAVSIHPSSWTVLWVIV